MVGVATLEVSPLCLFYSSQSTLSVSTSSECVSLAKTVSNNTRVMARREEGNAKAYAQRESLIDRVRREGGVRSMGLLSAASV
jgi:hypothetical protein